VEEICVDADGCSATVEVGTVDVSETGADTEEDGAIPVVIGADGGAAGVVVTGRVVTAAGVFVAPIEWPHCVHAK